MKPGKQTDLTDGQILGAFAAGGDEATIRYRGTEPLTTDTSNVLLGIGALGAGDYEDEIDLIESDKESGAVTVKLTVKDWWLYPLLALAAGILLGLWLQRLAGVSIPRYRLRGRVDDLTTRYAEAKRGLDEAAAGEDWMTFAVDDLPARQKQLRDEIDAGDKAPLRRFRREGARTSHGCYRGHREDS